MKSNNFVNALQPEADPLDDRGNLPILPSRAIAIGPNPMLQNTSMMLGFNAKVKELSCSRAWLIIEALR
jgi:hypothetical protein